MRSNQQQRHTHTQNRAHSTASMHSVVMCRMSNAMQGPLGTKVVKWNIEKRHLHRSDCCARKSSSRLGPLNALPNHTHNRIVIHTFSRWMLYSFDVKKYVDHYSRDFLALKFYNFCGNVFDYNRIQFHTIPIRNDFLFVRSILIRLWSCSAVEQEWCIRKRKTFVVNDKVKHDTQINTLALMANASDNLFSRRIFFKNY